MDAAKSESSHFLLSNDTMKTFTTRPGSFREIRKKTIPVMTGIFAGLFLLAVVVPALIRSEPESWTTLPLAFLIFAFITGWATWSTLRRQKRSFETYRLSIDAEKLVRAQFNTPTITIYIKDITEIVRNVNGSFTVVGTNQLNAIGIPSQIEHYDDLRTTLQQIHAVKERSERTFAEKIFIPASLSAALLIAITTISENDAVNLLCSTMIVCIMVAGMIVIFATKNIDRRTKRLSWIFLIPVISYVARIVSLLGQ